MTLIGGAGAFIGPIVGSVIYTMLQAVVKMYTVYWPLTIGTVILLIVLFAPGGIRYHRAALARRAPATRQTARPGGRSERSGSATMSGTSLK